MSRQNGKSTAVEIDEMHSIHGMKRKLFFKSEKHFIRLQTNIFIRIIFQCQCSVAYHS